MITYENKNKNNNNNNNNKNKNKIIIKRTLAVKLLKYIFYSFIYLFFNFYYFNN